MADHSFWERLGRGVGYGWQKAKELGSQMSEAGEEPTDLQKEKDTLRRGYSELGKLVAEELLTGGAQAFALDSDEKRNLLEGIRRQRDAVEQMEKELEARKSLREASTEEAPTGSKEPLPPEDPEESGSTTGGRGFTEQ